MYFTFSSWFPSRKCNTGSSRQMLFVCSPLDRVISRDTGNSIRLSHEAMVALSQSLPLGACKMLSSALDSKGVGYRIMHTFCSISLLSPVSCLWASLLSWFMWTQVPKLDLIMIQNPIKITWIRYVENVLQIVFPNCLSISNGHICCSHSPPSFLTLILVYWVINTHKKNPYRIILGSYERVIVTGWQEMGHKDHIAPDWIHIQ